MLANILVEATDKGIRLSGTDLDIAVTTEVAADVETPGAITIPAKKLSEIARELPPAPVRIAAAGEQRVTLDCGRTHFKILGLPRDEFPAFPNVRFNESWRIRSGDLQKLISHTSFAVSTEESRPILNGVLWELKPDMMRMVATNGHRLAKMEMPIKSGGAPPTRSDRSAEGARADPPALSRGRGARDREGREPPRLPLAVHRGVHAADRRTVSELRPGHSARQQSRRHRRSHRAARARCAACRSSRPIRRIAFASSFNAGMLKFSVQTPDLGEATDELAVRYTGDPLDIGFNANYLLEILRYIPTDEVRLTFKAPERAATLEPEGWADPASYLCLVMPLRLLD